MTTAWATAQWRCEFSGAVDATTYHFQEATRRQGSGRAVIRIHPNAGTCPVIPTSGRMGNSALGQGKYVSLRSMSSSGSLAQKLGRHVPVLAIVGDDGDRLAIVPSDHSGHERASVRFKRHAIADSELEHARVSAHLIQEPQSLDNPIVEVDELGFGQSVDVNVHGCA
jgi:hypothetical protein